MTVNRALLADWRALGILFAEPPNLFADPEITLLNSLTALITDSKLLYLITSWIRLHCDIVHCERLLSLTKSRRLNYDELMALGGLVEFAMSMGHKLGPLQKHIQSKIKKNRVVMTAEYMALPVSLGQCPAEPSFAKYGISVPTLLDLSSKIADIKLMIKTSAWIKNRIFFGCNWRADIFTTLNQGKSKTKISKVRSAIEMSTYRLAKDIGCSNETALRIRKSFELAGAPGFEPGNDGIKIR